MSNEPTVNITLSNKRYDTMKFVVQLVLPALGVLYASLAGFWGWPKVNEVVGSIAAVALFLGVVLRISSGNYEPPEESPVGRWVVVEKEDGTKTVTLDLWKDPEEFIDGDKMVFTKAELGVSDKE